ncbi:MAG: cytochrome b/b6 domain-containing protein [Candidatus Diapherotrites archaeon]
MDRFLLAKKAVHWAFMAVTVVIVVSGFGISYYREVEALTFGLLNKALSFTLHDVLTIPFVVLLVLHLYLTVLHKRIFRKKKR